MNVVYVVCISVCMVCELSKFIVCFVSYHKRIVKTNTSFALLANIYLWIVDISTPFVLPSVEGAC